MTKPTRIEVPFFAALRQIFPEDMTLLHDMQEGDVLCETCKGTGLAVDKSYVYGVHEEPRDWRHLFPYTHQQMQGCADCAAGIRRMCPYCKKLLNRYELQHIAKDSQCPGQLEAKRLEAAAKEEERRKTVPRILLGDYSLDMVYCDDCSEYLHVDSIDDDDAHADHTLFACRESQDWVRPQADDVIENMMNQACDALDDGDKSVDISDEGKAALQALLDKWMDEHVSLNTVYWNDNDLIVEVPPPAAAAAPPTPSEAP